MPAAFKMAALKKFLSSMVLCSAAQKGIIIKMDIIQTGFVCEEKLKIFINLFFPENEDGIIYTDLKKNGKEINAYTEIVYNGKPYVCDYYTIFDYKDNKSEKNIEECALIKSFIRAASKIRKVPLPWGVMCGIRPAKMVRELYERGFSKNEAYDYLSEVYEISDSKLKLAFKVAENEKNILLQNDNSSVSIYIGIPFCPTRCLYCSFVSTDIRVSGKYMDDFVKCLLAEIEKTAEILKKSGKYVQNIYIGGGTPTTLSEANMERVLSHVEKYFVSDKLKEYTLEAGRPDTISREKLKTAKKYGVTRISINPQTMNNETLVRIGRSHDADMIRKAFSMAREEGFYNINMDLIAGLTGETPEMFYKSIDEVCELNPENITVHCMCVKRAARLKKTGEALSEFECIIKMLDYAERKMNETGREPYYMYRQKNMSGNMENVGYAKPGYMSFYNINIMEEVQTIVALGGGGSTKIVKNDNIERIFNFKDPVEYINRFDEIIKKKEKLSYMM